MPDERVQQLRDSRQLLRLSKRRESMFDSQKPNFACHLDISRYLRYLGCRKSSGRAFQDQKTILPPQTQQTVVQVGKNGGPQLDPRIP